MTREEALVAFRRAGLDVDYVTDGSDDRWYAKYSGTLTFAQLDEVSRLFGTKEISLGNEEGCESDPSCDPFILVKKT